MGSPAENRKRRWRRRHLIELAVAAAAVVLVATAGAYVTTDQQDYTPGSVVTISGGNDANGAPGYLEGRTVDVAVSGPNGWTSSCSATVAANGSWACTVTLSSDPRIAVGNYSYTATSTSAEGNLISESGSFSDNASVTVAAPATFVWHRTGEVAGGFDVPVSGTYSCNNTGSNCTSITKITVTVPGVSGSKEITSGLSTGVTNAAWSTTLQFRTLPGAGQFAIPSSGAKYNVTAVLDTNLSDASDTENNHFGVDNTAPSTTIQCNAAGCGGVYSANVQVKLNGSDGSAATSSGVASTSYCVDTANACTPTTAYPGGAGFAVTYVAGATYYVRYGSTDNVGNIESTNSQAIVFSAPDTTPPVISSVLTPASPDGNNGWYKTNVSLVWTVTDPESTVTKTGCVDQSITTNQAATTYSCSATSAGGAAGPVDVSVKRDASAPTVSVVSVKKADLSTYAPGTWTNQDVTVDFSCADNGPSGVETLSPDPVTKGEGKNQTATTTCTDNAGNSANGSVTDIDVDKTKPTITAAATTPPNGAGWYNGDVTVHFTCTDALSGVPTGGCPADQTLSSEGVAVSSTAQTVTDAAGNTSDPSNVVTVKIDKTKPTISAAATSLPNGAGWYNADVTVQFTCTDALSGIPTGGCPANQTLNTEGVAVSSTAEVATDAAGNTSDPSNVVTVQIDKTKPTTVVSHTANGSNGWNTTAPVGTSISVGDSLSGIAAAPVCTDGADPLLATGLSTPYGASVSGEGIHNVSCTVADNAGNTSDPGTDTVKIDTIAPNAPIASVSPAPNVAGWNNTQPVTVSFAGNGDGGTAADKSGVGSCTAAVTFSAESATTAGGDASGTCTDNAGNESATTTKTVKIDLTKPTISAAATTSPNADGWYKTDVTVHFTCADALSGIPTGTCPANQVLSTEGTSVSSTAQTVNDAADNTSDTSNVVTVKLDKTKPVVTVTGVANGATYVLGSVPVPGCTTSDALSGVKTSATVSSSGGPVGSITTTCSGAVDNADNTNSASVTYTVIFNWTGFFQPVDNLPTLNLVKAGSAIPVKFNLGGDQGLNIFAAGFPKSQSVECGTTATEDPIEATITAGGSSLTYDATAGQYVYVWKTDKSWTGCRTLSVKLVDGTLHQANFKFK